MLLRHLLRRKLHYSHLNKNSSIDWVEETFPLSPVHEQQFLTPAISQRVFSLLAFLTWFLIAILLLRVSYMQLVKGSSYSRLSKNNKTRVHTLLPQRGIIYDRNGQMLVSNVSTFSLGIRPIDLPDDNTARQNLFQTLETIIQIPAQEIEATISQVDASYADVVVIKNPLPYEAAVLLKIHLSNTPGVVFLSQNRRRYETTQTMTSGESKKLASETHSPSLSHVLGYMSMMTESEFRNSDGYLFHDFIGRAGVENSFEDILRGVPGHTEIEVDARENQIKILSKSDALPGTDIMLTIDAVIQSQLERIMREALKHAKQQRAVGILLNPQTGGILALVSLPTFDNNIFAEGITRDAYLKLMNDPDNPLFFRAISGMYPPGSTIKPLIAIAALQEEIVTPSTTVSSFGGLRISKWFFPDWKLGGHGATNLNKAIAWSVNTYFYFIGGGYGEFRGLGLSTMTRYLQQFQLAQRTGIDLPAEAVGFVPSETWKQQTKGEPWYIGDTYHLAIGQGDVLVTPLQVAHWTAWFANNGISYQPHVLSAIWNQEKSAFESIVPKQNHSLEIENQYIQLIKKAMQNTVLWGSAQGLKNVPVPVAAKTGTAQWSQKQPPHAWLTGFAPYENPQLVFTILVESGGEGSGISLSIAREFLNWYFRRSTELTGVEE